MGRKSLLRLVGKKAAAAPTIPVLTRSLRDSDRFVRWAAARTLGKLAPKAERRSDSEHGDNAFHDSIPRCLTPKGSAGSRGFSPPWMPRAATDLPDTGVDGRISNLGSPRAISERSVTGVKGLTIPPIDAVSNGRAPPG